MLGRNNFLSVQHNTKIPSYALWREMDITNESINEI